MDACKGIFVLYTINGPCPWHQAIAGPINNKNLNAKLIPYSYKFLRDVYFTDATNSAFSRFYFRGSQDFVLVYYVGTILI